MWTWELKFTTVGIPFFIIGALVGGFMISRFGLKKMLWPFILLQNLTNIVYMMLAFKLSWLVELNSGSAEPVFMSFHNLYMVIATHTFELFAGGLGTSVLMTFLMRICKDEFKAAHYAIGTALMSVSGVITGIISGFVPITDIPYSLELALLYQFPVWFFFGFYENYEKNKKWLIFCLIVPVVNNIIRILIFICRGFKSEFRIRPFPKTATKTLV